MIKDIFLSDSYFIERYEKSRENDNKIKKLAEELSIFKYPLLDISLHSPISYWPSNQPLILTLEIINHGPYMDYSEININLSEKFEFIRPSEQVIQDLPTKKKISVSFQILPRVVGIFKDFLKINAIHKNKSVSISFHSVDIKISPNYVIKLRKQSKKDNESLKKLVAAFKKTKIYDKIEKLPKLFQIDSKSCLNKIRSAFEVLLQNAPKKIKFQM